MILLHLAQISLREFERTTLRRPPPKSVVFGGCARGRKLQAPVSCGCAVPYFSPPPVRWISAIVARKCLNALHPSSERRIVDLHWKEARGQLSCLRALERPAQQLKPGKDDHVYRGEALSNRPVGFRQARLDG